MPIGIMLPVAGVEKYAPLLWRPRVAWNWASTTADELLLPPLPPPRRGNKLLAWGVSDETAGERRAAAGDRAPNIWLRDRVLRVTPNVEGVATLLDATNPRNDENTENPLRTPRHTSAVAPESAIPEKSPSRWVR